MTLGGLFNKDIKQTSTTNNVDNTRVSTLTDSMNQWINQTKAESNVYNSAFDATDSFNSVANFSYANVGGNAPDIPQQDFIGLRSLLTNPADLASLINANTISKDPNANKYNFNFDSQSASGNDFLAKVQDMVRTGWQGMASTSSGTAANAAPKSLTFYLAVAAAVVVGLFLILKFRK